MRRGCVPLAPLRSAYASAATSSSISAQVPESALVIDLRTAIAKDTPVIVCGSTAEGEEELILGAFKAVQQQFPAAIMVLSSAAS